MQIGFLGTIAGQFGDAGHRLALALALLDFTLYDFCYILMDVQVVVNLLLDEVTYIFINAFAIRRHLGGAQLDLGLTLEDGFLHIDGDGGDDAGTDVTIFVFAE